MQPNGEIEDLVGCLRLSVYLVALRIVLLSIRFFGLDIAELLLTHPMSGKWRSTEFLCFFCLSYCLCLQRCTEWKSSISEIDVLV